MSDKEHIAKEALQGVKAELHIHASNNKEYIASLEQRIATLEARLEAVENNTKVDVEQIIKQVKHQFGEDLARQTRMQFGNI